MFPALPAILLYFETLPNHWWLQLLKNFPRCLQSCCILMHGQKNCRLQSFKFSTNACNPVIFSNFAQFLVACLESCCILTYGKITGGFNNLNSPHLPAILFYFHNWQKNWWPQWLSIFPRCLQSCCLVTHCNISRGFNSLNSPVTCNLLVFWYISK